MFIGHFALGFAAKRLDPSISLGTLFAACQLADLVWPVLVLAGIEVVEVAPGSTQVTPLDFVHYPYSHSLVALLGWGAALGVGYALMRRRGALAAVVLGGLVLSHWVLDVITHRPDMPLTLAGSTKLGLGLWNSVPATAALEVPLFAAGVFVYARATTARDRKGRVALIALCAFLLVTYVANLLGPPPPSARMVAGGALAVWLLVAWGYYIDSHRRPVAAPA
jgi:hypothetical protein